MILECLECYCEFDQRTDAPDMRVCADCIPNPAKMDDVHCPKCGWNAAHDDAGETIIETKNRRFNSYMSMEYGGDPYDWDEVHKCPLCGTIFEFENGTH